MRRTFVWMLALAATTASACSKPEPAATPAPAPTAPADPVAAVLADLDDPARGIAALTRLAGRRPDDARIVAAVAAKVRAPSGAVRATAVRTLGSWGATQRTAVAPALADADPTVRDAAIAALASMGAAGRPDLRARLADADAADASRIVAAVAPDGREAVDVLAAAATCAHPEARAAACAALAAIGAEGRAALVAALDLADVSGEAERTLRELGDAGVAAVRAGTGTGARRLAETLDRERLAAAVAGLADAARSADALATVRSFGPKGVAAVLDAFDRGAPGAQEAVLVLGGPALDLAQHGLAAVTGDARTRRIALLLVAPDADSRTAGLVLADDADVARESARAVVASGAGGLRRLVTLRRAADAAHRGPLDEAIRGAGAAAVPPLVQAVVSGDATAGALLVEILVTLGDAGTDAVAMLLGGDEAEALVGVAAARKLGEQGLALLAQAVAHPSERVRTEARAAFGPESVGTLLEFLRSGSPAVRRGAAETLAGLGDAGVERLVGAAYDKDPEVRVAVLHGLGRVAPPPPAAVAAVRNALSSKDAGLSRAAASAARRWGKAAKPLGSLLEAAASSRDPLVGLHAGIALVRCGDRAAAQWPFFEARAALSSPDGAVVADALAAIAESPPTADAAAQARWFALLPNARTAPGLVRAIEICGPPHPLDLVAMRCFAVSTTDRAARELVEAAAAEIWEKRTWERAPDVGGVHRGSRADRAKAPFPRGTPLRKVAPAVDAALDWLVRHQAEDGGWDAPVTCRHGGGACDGGGLPQYRVGVSALATMCFTAEGNGRTVGPHRDVVRKATDALLRSQDDAGAFGGRSDARWLYNHSLATLALLEAYAIDLDPALHGRLQKAVELIETSQVPYLAWGYRSVPKHPERVDIEPMVSACALYAWDVARAVGFPVRPATPIGVLGCIDKMTDPEFGKVGYDQRGGLPFRTGDMVQKFPPSESEALTAAGMYVRALVHRVARGDAAKDEFIWKGGFLLGKKRPKWDVDAGCIDLWYWWWGTMATQQVKDVWDDWYAALATALTDSQRTGANVAGSWDGEDPWTPIGGRVYATAVACLALQTPWRTARVADSRSR